MAVSVPPRHAPPQEEQLPGLESTTSVLEAREQAIATLKRKRKFGQDAFAYVAVNGLLWLIWLITDRSTDGSIPWPAWVSLVWAFFLALDGWRAYGGWPTNLNRPITEAEIERELERTSGR
jgi:hypothetical protein